MLWHIIEGEAGCRFARERGAVAIVVDALRASATAAMMLHAGALDILVVREVEDALAAKRNAPDALLFGERGGVPPAGFDFGNSPREVSPVAGRHAIFTTTTGANRLVSAWGSKAVFMGTTVNARAVVQAAASFNTDVVIIPAGLTGHPEFDAMEDRVASVYLAMQAGDAIGEGRAIFDQFAPAIEGEGLVALFEAAPHSQNLRDLGLPEDIAYCAQVDLTTCVPQGLRRGEAGIHTVNFSAGPA
ncbi:MAG: 2-phosphosulfolactate phosphatase [Candidatus Hydrogenedentes bacterium]|nr:2-phosphosulfolactate phosphatase [Candidatus Hydrogenedentota bacterium]